MREFKASNGIGIIKIEQGIGFRDIHGNPLTYGMNDDKVAALSEYFTVTKDEEFGRWRSSAFPNFVVYTVVAPGPNTYVKVINELNGADIVVDSGTLKRGLTTFHTVAEEYFLAKGIIKEQPWHTATAGEVWVLDLHLAGGNWNGAAILDENYNWVFEDDCIDQRAKHIISGRRIWPEDK